MKKISIVWLAVMMITIAPATLWAHVVNEQSLYEDIRDSSAKESIVYLSGLGVIVAEHGAPLFKPREKLTRAELAYWAGSFNKVKVDSASPQRIAQAALEQGIVSKLEGNATYEDVSQAFLGGQVTDPKLRSELTREEFAMFISDHWLTLVKGRTLFEAAGVMAGPTGVVESVTVSEKKDDAGSNIRSYAVQINGRSYTLSPHPKVVHASTDPTEWKGKIVKESWLMTIAGSPSQLQLMTFEGQSSAVSSKSDAEASHQSHGMESSREGSEFPWFPVVGGVLLVLLIIWLFRKK